MAVLRLTGAFFQAHHHAGDDAQGAFAADEQLLEVVAGVVLQHAVHRGDDRAVGQHRLQAQHAAAHHAVADHVDAAGVGGDVAAHGAGAARAQVHREHQALLAYRFLQLLQHHAGLHRGRAADRSISSIAVMRSSETTTSLLPSRGAFDAAA